MSWSPWPIFGHQMTPFLAQSRRSTFSNLQLNLCTSPFCWNKKRKSLTMPAILQIYGKWMGWNQCLTQDAVDILSTQNFQSIYTCIIAIQNANEIQSGVDPVTYKMQLGTIYKENHGSDFKFLHPKFMTLLQADNNQPALSDGKSKKGIGSLSNRPYWKNKGQERDARK